MRFASAALNTTAAEIITPNSTTSATASARWSRQRAGTAATTRRRRGRRQWPCRRRRRWRWLRHPRIVRTPGMEVAAWGRLTRLCQTRHHAAREAELEAPLLRGRHVRVVHRVRRVRHRVSPRRARLPRHRRRVQAVPARRGLGTGQLQPRREELHVVHPRVSSLPGVGARDRRVHVRPGPHQRRGVGHLQGHRPGPRHRPGARRGRPGRRPRLRAARLRARARHDRRRAGELPRG